MNGDAEHSGLYCHVHSSTVRAYVQTITKYVHYVKGTIPGVKIKSSNKSSCAHHYPSPLMVNGDSENKTRLLKNVQRAVT